MELLSKSRKRLLESGPRRDQNDEAKVIDSPLLQDATANGHSTRTSSFAVQGFENSMQPPSRQNTATETSQLASGRNKLSGPLNTVDELHDLRKENRFMFVLAYMSQLFRFRVGPVKFFRSACCVD